MLQNIFIFISPYGFSQSAEYYLRINIFKINKLLAPYTFCYVFVVCFLFVHFKMNLLKKFHLSKKNIFVQFFR